jgi:hypothetical protein
MVMIFWFTPEIQVTQVKLTNIILPQNTFEIEQSTKKFKQVAI